MTNADWRKVEGALESALIFNAEGEILATNVTTQGQSPVAVTTAGSVEGEHVQNGVVFRGVPFAAPPAGGLRYVPPQPPESWTGVRPCLAFGPGCPQLVGPEVPVLRNMLPAGEVLDEDCLYLNVWTPSLDGARRPVMVWIHGGGYTGGNSAMPIYHGDAFLREDVVFVSINYRLGALGFLHLAELFPNATSTGNLGILDIIAGLGWVKDNITAFGGDPGRITVFGESAGGSAVATLLGTPAAHGLFSRAIVMSSAPYLALPGWAATLIAARTLDRLGVKPGDWEGLRAVPSAALTAITAGMHLEVGDLLQGDPTMPLPWAPVVDGATLPRRAIESVRNGSAAGVDLIVGTCADEYRLFRYGIPSPVPVPDPDLERYFAGSDQNSAKAEGTYLASRPDSSHDDFLVAMQTDYLWTIPAIRLAEAQALHHDRVWMYRLTWRTPVADGTLGACHALDLPFLFDKCELASTYVGDEPPADLGVDMRAAWTRFAAAGDPSPRPDLAWPTYDATRRSTLLFDTERYVVSDPSGGERALWDGLL
jgi:para-nitrobenzyl esterase